MVVGQEFSVVFQGSRHPPRSGCSCLPALLLSPTEPCPGLPLTLLPFPRGKPEIVGSNLDTLVSIGLDEKFPQDYRLAQQVCLAIANISDRRKVGDVGWLWLG